MKTLKIHTSMNSYDFVIGSGLMPEVGKRSADFVGKKALAVSDENVFALYGEKLRASLENTGKKFFYFVFPAGEKAKSPETLFSIIKHMTDLHFSRSDCVFALGGGVTGDLAGLAAALYMRGTRFIQLPTSVLAAADSCVGGKTAVDFCGQKNLLGCFYQPSLVLCDTDCFATLPENEIKNGFAEIIKCAAVADEKLFYRINDITLEDGVFAAVEIKKQLVESDEFDRGLRHLLNFGHTAGHAIETLTGFEISHGEAVSMGMVLEARAAEKLAIAADGTCDRLISALYFRGLPTEIPYTAAELAEAAASDKKSEGNGILFALPNEIGNGKTHFVPNTELRSFFAAGGAK